MVYVVALKISFMKSEVSLVLDPWNETEPDGEVVVVVVVVLVTTLGVDPSSHVAGVVEDVLVSLVVVDVVAGVTVYDADGALTGEFESNKFEK